MEFRRLNYEIPSCSICFEECLTKLAILDCGHVFHRSCMIEWIEKEKRCPLCRKVVYSTFTELIFTIKKKEIDESSRFSALLDENEKITLDKLMV